MCTQYKFHFKFPTQTTESGFITQTGIRSWGQHLVWCDAGGQNNSITYAIYETEWWNEKTNRRVEVWNTENVQMESSFSKHRWNMAATAVYGDLMQAVHDGCEGKHGQTWLSSQCARLFFRGISVLVNNRWCILGDYTEKEHLCAQMLNCWLCLCLCI